MSGRNLDHQKSALSPTASALQAGRDKEGLGGGRWGTAEWAFILIIEKRYQNNSDNIPRAGLDAKDASADLSPGKVQMSGRASGFGCFLVKHETKNMSACMANRHVYGL